MHKSSKSLLMSVTAAMLAMATGFWLEAVVDDRPGGGRPRDRKRRVSHYAIGGGWSGRLRSPGCVEKYPGQASAFKVGCNQANWPLSVPPKECRQLRRSGERAACGKVE